MRVIRLSPIAETDIVVILAHSEANFGEAARLRYEALLEAGACAISPPIPTVSA